MRASRSWSCIYFGAGVVAGADESSCLCVMAGGVRGLSLAISLLLCFFSRWVRRTEVEAELVIS